MTLGIYQLMLVLVISFFFFVIRFQKCLMFPIKTQVPLQQAVYKRLPV